MRLDRPARGMVIRFMLALLLCFLRSTIVEARTPLTASTIYYIDNQNGSDSNDGLTLATAFASFEKAWDVTINKIDTAGYGVTIQAAMGQTWSGLRAWGTPVGGGSVTFDAGHGTINAPSGAFGLAVQNAYIPSQLFTVQNAVFTCSVGAAGSLLLGGGYGAIGPGVVFADCPGGGQIMADGPSRIYALADYTISGGASTHLSSVGLGLIDYNNSGITVTIINNPHFTGAFVAAYISGTVISFIKWSGPAMGPRWAVTQVSNIYTGTGNCEGYWPGDTNGWASSGGQCN